MERVFELVRFAVASFVLRLRYDEMRTREVGQRYRRSVVVRMIEFAKVEHEAGY